MSGINRFLVDYLISKADSGEEFEYVDVGHRPGSKNETRIQKVKRSVRNIGNFFVNLYEKTKLDINNALEKLENKAEDLTQPGPFLKTALNIIRYFVLWPLTVLQGLYFTVTQILPLAGAAVIAGLLGAKGISWRFLETAKKIAANNIKVTALLLVAGAFLAVAGGLLSLVSSIAIPSVKAVIASPAINMFRAAAAIALTFWSDKIASKFMSEQSGDKPLVQILTQTSSAQNQLQEQEEEEEKHENLLHQAQVDSASVANTQENAAAQQDQFYSNLAQTVGAGAAVMFMGPTYIASTAFCGAVGATAAEEIKTMFDAYRATPKAMG